MHWAYYGCSKEDEEQLQQCWEERQRHLRSRLDAFPDEPTELELVAYRQEQSPQWQIQSSLHLPARTVVVRAAQNEADAAVENAVFGLIDELDQLTERPVAVPRRKEGLQGIIPILEHSRRDGRNDVSWSWLTPVVASLHSHVRRELAVREMESGLAAGQVVPDDVLDEVLVRAYERFDRRPGGRPLDLWLLQLADEVLEESCGPLAEKSLDAQVEKPSTEPRGSSRDSSIEWATFSETVELGDLLPGMPAADTWDSLDLETKKAESDRMLARLPRRQRQAVVLNIVYGYSLAEVADFQGRGEDLVRADIDQGRRSLEQYFRNQHLLELEQELAPSPRRTSRRGGA
jgi:DNA-directed RNA polymerase specialized sigma24 family protein